MGRAGVCMLGCITALGAAPSATCCWGTIRRSGCKTRPNLALTAVAAFATILIARQVHRLNLAFLVLDAIGLVVFTMAGCDVAWQMNASLPIMIVAGMITGWAGVLRDILCNDVPLLFRAELYASVSVVTGLFYATAFGLNLNDQIWTALTFALGLTLRLLAIRYKWEMPKFVFDGIGKLSSTPTEPHPEEPRSGVSKDGYGRDRGLMVRDGALRLLTMRGWDRSESSTSFAPSRLGPP